MYVEKGDRYISVIHVQCHLYEVGLFLIGLKFQLYSIYLF